MLSPCTRGTCSRRACGGRVRRQEVVQQVVHSGEGDHVLVGLALSTRGGGARCIGKAVELALLCPEALALQHLQKQSVQNHSFYNIYKNKVSRTIGFTTFSKMGVNRPCQNTAMTRGLSVGWVPGVQWLHGVH